MSKPAARMGDMTAHGGSIVVGFPTVLIAGQPAARLMDMHVCPMLTPGTPPIPHVGGPISGPGSPTVLIGGMPAAVMGDMCVCVGPPDTIALGAPTVLIGMSGSGGGSAGSTGGGGAAGANVSAAVAKFNNNESVTTEEHWIAFKVVDKAGLPVSGLVYSFEDMEGATSEGVLRLDGTVRRDALPEQGSCKVTLMNVLNARWDKDEAEVGDPVTLTADVVGFESGTPATFQVCKRDLRGADVLVATIAAETQADTVEGSWSYEHPEEAEPTAARESQAAYSSPRYYFEVLVGACKARSGLMRYIHAIEIELADADGKPLANEDYVITLQSGETRTGTLDGNGYAKIDDVPPGFVTGVRFPGLEEPIE